MTCCPMFSDIFCATMRARMVGAAARRERHEQLDGLGGIRALRSRRGPGRAGGERSRQQHRQLRKFHVVLLGIFVRYAVAGCSGAPFSMTRYRKRYSLGIVVGVGLVHHAAVVPDHHVAGAPLVAVLVLALRGVLVELVDELESLVRRHPFDALHARGVDVERGAAVLGVADHERLHGLGNLRALLGAQRGHLARALAALVHVRGAQLDQLAPLILGQLVERLPHVHELRVAADLGQVRRRAASSPSAAPRKFEWSVWYCSPRTLSLPSTSGRSLLEIVPTSGWSGSVNFLTCCSMRSPNRRAASANCGGVRCWSRITSTACSIHASYSDLRGRVVDRLRQVDAGRFRADGLGKGLDGQGHGSSFESRVEAKSP